MRTKEELLAFAKANLVKKTRKERIIKEGELEWYIKNMAGKGYEFSDDSLRALEIYLRGYGLLLSGAVGTGKTFFFKCLPADTVVLTPEILSEYPREDLREFVNGYSDREVVLDDLGVLTEYQNSFGNVYSPVLTFCNCRTFAKRQTHFTTNLGGEKLRELDQRLYDRIVQLARGVEFKNCKSYRSPMIYQW